LTPGHIELFKIKFNTFMTNQMDTQNHPAGSPNIPTSTIGQSSTLSKENQQQPQKLIPTSLNGVNNDTSLVVVGYGQQNYPHPPAQNNVTNPQFIPPQNTHQNHPVIVNNAFVGSPTPPITPIQQQPPQQQQNFNQYNTLMNQIPIHQSFMMPR
jgi:hypothetical protein